MIAGLLDLQAVRKWGEDRVDSFAVSRFLRELVKDVGRYDFFGAAAEMAYRFLFSLFPLLLVIIASLGFIGQALGLDDLFEQVMDEVEPFLPEQVAEIVRDHGSDLFVVQSVWFLVVGFGGALWGAAGGVNTIIKGLNRVYRVRKKRPFVRRQALSMALTLTLPLGGLSLLALTLISHHGGEWLGDQLGVGPILDDIVSIARWPVLILLLAIIFTLIYHVLPNRRAPYVQSLPGAAFATVAWLVLTEGFNIYLDNFADYEAVYGAFGVVIAFMLWLYLVGVIILIGGGINALFSRDQRPRWRAKPTPLERTDLPPEVDPTPSHPEPFLPT
jgi:membrane protein